MVGTTQRGGTEHKPRGDSSAGDVAGDLPVQQPTKFEFVINMKIAKSMGMTIPPALLRWEDPNTGAHGTVTPLPSTYQQSGVTCRDVLMSYVRRATCRGFRARLATVGAASGKCAI